MRPASPATTLVERMASSSEVLPWSTWPMMVTTGGRGVSPAGSSTLSNSPSSTSDSATRLTVWPSSSAMSWAVSVSITSVILSICPCFMSSVITARAGSARANRRLLLRRFEGRRARGQRAGQPGFGFLFAAEALLGFQLGPFLGLLVVPAALVFLALAGLGGLAVPALDGVTGLANAR